MGYFGFSAFSIVLSVLMQQGNVTEVEVSVEIEQ